MYSPSITAKQLESALASARVQYQKAGGGSLFDYKPLTPAASQELANRLNEAIDDEGKLSRKLTLEEQRLIISERTLCRWDARYYWTHYYKISHMSTADLILFEPNVAQNIILDTWAEREDRDLHIMQIHLKARQVGDTTLWQAAIAHRVQFHSNTRAVIGSSRPEKSLAMVDKAMTAWTHVPWYLRPRMTRYKAGELIDFGVLHSSINIQHGAKVKSGVARGETPLIGHFSECAEYLNPTEDIDSAVLFAMHPNPATLLGLESTAKGQGNWWHLKWSQARDNWGVHPTQLQPVFIPWYVAKDIYPTETWLRDNVVPSGWKPSARTERHAKKAADYVANTPLLQKYLGSTWSMPISQQWYWESTRSQYDREKILNKFYQELCIAKGSRVSTNRGIIPIEDVKVGDRTECGDVSRVLHNGRKEIVEVRTYQGRRLRCTKDHKLNTLTGWEEAQTLVGKKIWLSAPKLGPNHDPNLARFLGYFMGDGCLYGTRVIFGIDKKDPEVLDDVLTNCFDTLPWNPRVESRGGMWLVTSQHKSWIPLLEKLGVVDDGRRKVCVPALVWSGDVETVRNFLSALFECDGHSAKRYTQTSLSSKHRKFLEDVQLLLLGFDINSRISKDPKQMWRLTLNGRASDLFHERIGFVSVRKRTSGKRCSTSGVGRPPQANCLIDRVEEVVTIGEEDVYDLTIPGSNCFGAGGILVHNCADDIEAFQHEGASVFDAELIMRYNDLVNAPISVYGLRSSVSDEIRAELQPDVRQVDPNKPPIKIEAVREGGLKTTYTLVPLRLDGYPMQFNPIGKILIWENPQDNVEYGMGVDTAQGIGLDRSVCEIIRKATLTKVPRQCAEFASEWVSASDLFPYAHCLAKLYSRKDADGNIRQPKIVVETNNGGDACQLAMRKAGWGNMHAWIRYDKKVIDASKANFLGAVTTNWSRDLILGHLIKALRDGHIDIDSRWFITEMQELVKDQDRARIAAILGGHDDRFMAMAWIYLSMHILEFGEIRSTFGKGRILDEAEVQKAATKRPPAPEELPVAADYVADRMIQGTSWYPGDSMDSPW